MQMFNPFAFSGEQADDTAKTPASAPEPASSAKSAKPEAEEQPSTELNDLREQMSALQKQLESLANRKD
jgi:polyhydroxyalkanoate synthesis regulator protein